MICTIAIADGILSLFVLFSYSSLSALPSSPFQNASALLSFLSGYSWYVQHILYALGRFLPYSHLRSFMGPLAGVMCSDYYLVRKGKLNVKELYNPNGLYRYTHGWNWRAHISFLYVAYLRIV